MSNGDKESTSFIIQRKYYCSTWAHLVEFRDSYSLAVRKRREEVALHVQHLIGATNVAAIELAAMHDDILIEERAQPVPVLLVKEVEVVGRARRHRCSRRGAATVEGALKLRTQVVLK